MNADFDKLRKRANPTSNLESPITNFHLQMQRTIRWGIIGCGDVAEKKSGPPLYRTPGSELVAVMRRDVTRAKDFARRHNAQRWYTDARALIDDEQVNAVYIASPHYLHRAHATLAAEAGKIVFCEKPMGANARDAQAIVDVCKKNRVLLAVAYYRRYWPTVRSAQRMLKEKIIGDVVSARVQLSDYFPDTPRADWLVSKKMAGGGALANAGSHWIDLTRFLIGEIAEVSAYAESKRFQVDETVAVLMRTREGIPVSFTATWQSQLRVNEIEIIGTRGKMLIGPLSEGQWSVFLPDRVPEVRQFFNSGPAHTELVNELVSRLQRGKPSPIPGEEAVAAWRVMEAIYKSCKTGKRVIV
jgi:predicted dehydrogenase